jgi:hypothetical protein
MNPLFEVIFAVLVAELVLLAFLVGPLPSSVRAPIVRWMSGSSLIVSLVRPLSYFFGMVALTWLFTTREMLQLQAEHEAMRATWDLGQKLQHESRMFRSQRNFYLVGACALLLLVLRRIYTLTKDVHALTATKEALKKQAEGAAAAYKALQADTKKPPADAPAPAAAKGEAVAPATSDKKDAASDESRDTLREEVASLQSALSEAEAQRDTANKSAEALKRQAEGLSTEYARLTREKEKLENRLSDFELLMGDEAKKKR